jgi:hypothetical protein
MASFPDLKDALKVLEDLWGAVWGRRVWAALVTLAVLAFVALTLGQIGSFGKAVYSTFSGWISPTSPPQVPNKDIARTLDGTIKMECLYEVFRFPPEGKLLELIVHSTTDPVASFQTLQISELAYKANPKAIPTKDGMIDKCRITNYGPSSAFNVKISLQVQISERIDNGPQIRIVANKDFVIVIPEVGAAAANAVDLYAWNTTKFFVALVLPKQVELQRLGSVKREIVQLIPAFNLLSFFPAVSNTEPGASAPPLPSR